MSTGSGGPFRGRGRGSTQPGIRGASRGRGPSNGGRGRGAAAGAGATRGAASNSGGQRGGAFATAKHPASSIRGGQTQNAWQDRYTAMKPKRDQERKNAIRQGLMADPDKPRSLADAITPVGTCQDMCPEFERVQRVAQDDVWVEEMDPDTPADARGPLAVDETRMVKKFRRSAAGYEEQLPSDLRPPAVLSATCDYLFNDVIGTASSLAKVHHFVWDRTRAIRNDLSIQQLSKPDDVRIAIDCYERIARFHILSLHQFAQSRKPYEKYDYFQEREQLDRALLSLMQYYDDHQGQIELKNEAEFRAYCVIFQLQDPTPDLETRIQSWPNSLVQTMRVRKALEIYTAACNTTEPKGPLKPTTPQVLAQQNWEKFWTLLESPSVSYLMACVAEIYFSLVRRLILRTIVKTARVPRAPTSNVEFSISDIIQFLRFDTEEQAVEFCGAYGLTFVQNHETGERCLDISTLAGKSLPSNVETQSQIKSRLVERKRHGRALHAVINGFSYKLSQVEGFITEIEDTEDEVMVSSEEMGEDEYDDEQATEEDTDSLFVPDVKPGPTRSISTPSVFAKPSLFSQPPAVPSAPKSVFGAPRTGFNFTGAPAANTAPSVPAAQQDANTTKADQPPKFDFLAFGKPTGTEQAAAAPSPFAQPTTSGFGTPSGFQPARKTVAFAPTTVSEAPKLSETQPAASSLFSKPPQASEEKPKLTGFALTSASNDKPSIFSSQGLSTPSPFSTTTGFNSLNTSKAGSGTNPNTTAPANKDASATGNTLFKSPFSAASAPPTFNLEANPTTVSDSQNTNSIKFNFETPKAPASVTANTNGSALPNFAPAPAESLANGGAQQTTTANTNGTNMAVTSNTPSASAKASPNERLRSASITGDHRPKSPSPLAQSFTTFEDTPSFKTKAQTQEASAKPVAQDTRPTKTPSKPAPVNAAPVETPDAILTRLARELIEEPSAGFLKQFVDYTVGRIITDVQQKLYTEHINREADDFRHFTLAVRYAKSWREICRHRRLARQARDRRRRAQRRLRESVGLGERDDDSIADTVSINGSSFGGSVRSQREVVDEMYRSTLNSFSRYGGRRTASSKRSAPSQPDGYDEEQPLGHKRIKSTDHVDTAGSVTSATSNLRSSFLGFSLGNNDNINRTSTTKTSYFRLKALGIKPAATSGISRGSKRSRSQSVDQDPARSVSLVERIPQSVETERVRPSGLMLPPPAKISKAQSNEEDEALFARLRAARESLQEGKDFLKSELTKDDDLRRSTGSVSSLGDSLSLARARIEARLRASSAGTDIDLSSSQRHVPAYRSRYSRFVPRENYHKAIERANELRASRSRDVSGHATPTWQDMATTDDLNSERYSLLHEDIPTSTGFNTSDDPVQSLEVPKHHPAVIQQDVSSVEDFAAMPQAYAPATDESVDARAQQMNGYTEPPEHHVLRMDEPGDHTILASQVEEALSHSFGSSAVRLEYPPVVDPAFDETQPPTEQDADHAINLKHATPPAAYTHNNPFAALMDQDEDVEEHDDGSEEVEEESQNDAEMIDHNDNQAEQYESDEEVDEEHDSIASKDYKHHANPRQHYADDEDAGSEEDYDDEDADDEAVQYDEEDEETDGEMEDDEEGDSEDYDEDEEYATANGAYGRVRQERSESKNPELQDVGGTVEEAIELSD